MRARETVWRGDSNSGEGSIFYRLSPKRQGTDEERRLSRNLWLSYRAGGREHVVSAKTDKLKKAKQELRRLTRNRENAREGKEPLITPKVERITVGELLDANLRHARESKLATADQVGYRSETLKALLGHVLAVQFRPEHVDEYKRLRRLGGGGREKVRIVRDLVDGKVIRREVRGKVPVGDTTIRRELEVLSAAFHNARRRGVLRFVPFIEKPVVDNVRRQEIPLEEFPAILTAMADEDARDFVEWMLLTATRPKGIGGLRWEWFDPGDPAAWTLRVPSEKGGSAREFAVEGTLRAVIERRIARRALGCPFIFHRNGQRLGARQVRKPFYRALRARGFPVGVGGFTLYDTKKTAAGLLVDSGLSEAEAMAFSGHKTPSMFQRYVVKSSARHRESVRRRDEYLERRLADKKPEATTVEFPKACADKPR
jgi:integrase